LPPAHSPLLLLPLLLSLLLLLLLLPLLPSLCQPEYRACVPSLRTAADEGREPGEEKGGGEMLSLSLLSLPLSFFLHRSSDTDTLIDSTLIDLRKD